MDSYLLKCEETGIEALLVSIPTTSKLFSKITPHESTDPELEATLVEDLKNFRFEQALYCSATEQLLNKKDLDSDYIRSLDSGEFGKQSIYQLKEEISLDSLKKLILLDGHHRFAVINKHYIKEENEVPIIFVNFEDLIIEDHYFKANVGGSTNEDWLSPAINVGYRNVGYRKGYKEESYGFEEDYDFIVGFPVTNEDLTYSVMKRYYKNYGEQMKSRFDVRDEIFASSEFEFEPSKPIQDLMNLLIGESESDLYLDIFFAAKAPTKEELLSGEIFPTKSTWITPKFNPDLYREYLN